jgi:hypothetical protein
MRFAEARKEEQLLPTWKWRIVSVDAIVVVLVVEVHEK